MNADDFRDCAQLLVLTAGNEGLVMAVIQDVLDRIHTLHIELGGMIPAADDGQWLERPPTRGTRRRPRRVTRQQRFPPPPPVGLYEQIP